MKALNSFILCMQSVKVCVIGRQYFIRSVSDDLLHVCYTGIQRHPGLSYIYICDLFELFSVIKSEQIP